MAYPSQLPEFSEVAQALQTIDDAPENIRVPVLSASNRLVVVDSGCTNHTFSQRSSFVPGTIKDIKSKPIRGIGGASITPKQSGVAKVPTIVQGKPSFTLLQGVFLCPEAGVNLISVSQLAKTGLNLSFNNIGMICHSGNRICMAASLVGGLYIVQQPRTNIQAAALASFSYRVAPSDKIWHLRLCHLGDQSIQNLKSISTGIHPQKDQSCFCEACALG